MAGISRKQTPEMKGRRWQFFSAGFALQSEGITPVALGWLPQGRRQIVFADRFPQNRNLCAIHSLRSPVFAEGMAEARKLRLLVEVIMSKIEARRTASPSTHETTSLYPMVI